MSDIDTGDVVTEAQYKFTLRFIYTERKRIFPSIFIGFCILPSGSDVTFASFLRQHKQTLKGGSVPGAPWIRQWKYSEIIWGHPVLSVVNVHKQFFGRPGPTFFILMQFSEKKLAE